jgi:drug/metabolite transporter (DMT)-like permease
MRRRLRLWAAVFVVFGAVYAFTGWDREAAPWLLVIGIVLAVGSLLLDRFGRR